MFCSKCGNEIKENEKFCPACGNENISYMSSETIDKKTDDESVEETITNNYIQPSGITRFVTPKTLVIFGVLIVIIIALLVFFHFNSDTYKIEKATELVLQQSYTDAANKISNVYTPQAEIIRKYISVEKAKDDFMTAFDNCVNNPDCGGIIKSPDNEAYGALNTFTSEILTLNSESDLYLLPDKLRERFDHYYKAMDGINNTGLEWDDYMAAQNVFLNEVTCNREDRFTLDQLQENVNSSKGAIDNLKNDINKIPNMTSSEGEFIDCSQISTFKNLFDEFISACESEISSCQDLIDRDSKEFEMDDKLYRTKPDKDYKSYVSYNFEEIVSTSDSSINANILQYTLEVELMAFYLTY